MASTAPLFFPHLDASDADLLVAALGRSERAWRLLVPRLQPYLSKVVTRRAGDLPPDLREEVQQEVWAAIAVRPADDYDSSSSAAEYVGGFVGHAADRVRAAYRAPGERSRARDAARGTSESATDLDAQLEPDDFPDLTGERELTRLEAKLDIERAQAVASPEVAYAIKLILEEDYTYSEAANASGISRFTLRRELLQLASVVAAA